MKQLQQEIRQRLAELLSGEFPLNPEEILLTVPPERKFGDLATTVAFVIAKKTGQNPLPLADRLRDRLQGRIDFITAVQRAGNGFINFTLDKNFLLHRLLDNLEKPAAPRPEKVIVEHTSINPNKAAHIGHLRNSCLGDTLARSQRFLGYPVEVQNYIDDTGIQMADVIWGLLYHRRLGLAEIEMIERLADELWELYAEVNGLFEGDPALQAQRNQVHKKIEEKTEPEYGVCCRVAQRVLLDHIRVMAKLGIRYDLLVRESDIIALGLFTAAADLLKTAKVMYRSEDPEKSGCWVIYHQKEKLEKIIVRSNQTITYVGKDLAYNLWKFGLLEKDFYYDPFFAYPDGQSIRITSAQPSPPGPTATPAPAFGNGDKVFNVIDVRQSYLQSLIGQVLAGLGHERQSRNYVHFSYGMVALTPECVRELGFPLDAEQQKKSYIGVSGRKGTAVKADDLIDKMVEKAHGEVAKRNPDLGDDALMTVARQIAVAALRYFMIKFNLHSVIAFDFKEALDFEGDTGPYLQYTLVRLNSILKKLERPTMEAGGAELDCSILPEKELTLFWDIILNLAQCESQVELALQSLEPSSIASHAFTLCQQMNHYYHQFPVIAEPDRERQNLRLALIRIFKMKVGQLLQILGIEIPERM